MELAANGLHLCTAVELGVHALGLLTFPSTVQVASNEAVDTLDLGVPVPKVGVARPLKANFVAGVFIDSQDLEADLWLGALAGLAALLGKVAEPSE